MVRLASLVWLGALGCGRLGFDPAADGALDGPEDGAPALHDEDGDGVVDALDTCPHLAGPQVDSDGDGVGDACDWEPAIPRQKLAVVATMGPGQPFTIVAGAFEQRADALHFVGPGYGELEIPVSATAIQIDVGADITGTVGAGSQHQLAIGATGAVPLDFGELNEQIGSFSNAALTRFDGSVFLVQDGRTLPTNIHAGLVTMHVLLVPGGAATVDIAWPGEPYHLEVPATVYTQATEVGIRINNTVIDLRYVVVVTTR